MGQHLQQGLDEHRPAAAVSEAKTLAQQPGSLLDGQRFAEPAA
jgi:hypothetical protein